MLLSESSFLPFFASKEMEIALRRLVAYLRTLLAEPRIYVNAWVFRAVLSHSRINLFTT